MNYVRHVTLAATAVIGLMLLAGTGCGPKNEGEKVALQFMQRDLAESQKKYETAQAKVSCLTAANDITDQTARLKAINTCHTTYQN